MSSTSFSRATASRRIRAALRRLGKAYLDKSFPNLDRIVSATDHAGGCSGAAAGRREEVA